MRTAQAAPPGAPLLLSLRRAAPATPQKGPYRCLKGMPHGTKMSINEAAPIPSGMKSQPDCDVLISTFRDVWLQP